MRSIIEMVFRISYWLKRKIDSQNARYTFKDVVKEGKLIIGPELMTGFELRHPERIRFGNMSVISGNCFINAMGGVKIGSYCHIAKGLTIYSHNHNWHSTDYIPYDDKDIMRPVTIGDCVWIGCNVTIAPGATIEDGVIISSGSVVFGHVEKCAIVRGNPAVVVGYRDKDVFEKLYNEGKLK